MTGRTVLIGQADFRRELPVFLTFPAAFFGSASCHRAFRPALLSGLGISFWMQREDNSGDDLGCSFKLNVFLTLHASRITERPEEKAQAIAASSSACLPAVSCLQSSFFSDFSRRSHPWREKQEREKRSKGKRNEGEKKWRKSGRETGGESQTVAKSLPIF